MNLSEVNWDPNAAGTWPVPIKASAIFIVCCIVAGLCIYLDTLGQLEALEGVQQQEASLRTTFEEKQAKAANLPDYQYQLTKIEAWLEEMIKQMPTEAEVANLLVDISQSGLASGLEFKLFKPEATIPKDFYSELPIKIEVLGRYEQIGVFVSTVASLDRIVTVHDIDITPEDKEGLLRVRATIKTYNESGQGKTTKKQHHEVKP